MSRILFLDIDGVLNNKRQQDRCDIERAIDGFVFTL